MTVTYQVKNGIYVNMTNRCPCACTFCLRQNGDGVYGSDSLWLEREPTVAEVCASIDGWDLADFTEIVFCGYGEPKERLPELLQVAAHIREKNGPPIRINTNGLGNLIAGRDVTPELAGLVDVLSISLNTPDPAAYQRVCRSVYGEAAHGALIEFARLAARSVPKVIFSVVEGTISKAEIEACRKIAADCGATLRVREFIQG